MEFGCTEQLEKLFVEQVTKIGALVGYAPLGSIAERHGAYEYVLYRHIGGLDRYVVISFSDVHISEAAGGPSHGDDALYDIVVTYGVDSPMAWTRRSFPSLQVAPKKKGPWCDGLFERVHDALRAVEALTEQDLTEVHSQILESNIATRKSTPVNVN